MQDMTIIIYTIDRTVVDASAFWSYLVMTLTFHLLLILFSQQLQNHQ